MTTVDKVFSTKTHGMMDYATAGLFLALPKVLGWPGSVNRFLTRAALGTVLYSFLTRYELGLIKALPMEAHLGLDVMSGLIFCSAPLFFAGEEKSVGASLLGIGLFEIAVALTSETEPRAAELRPPAGQTRVEPHQTESEGRELVRA